MGQKYTVKLTSDEREILFEVLKKGKLSKQEMNRARILLKADCGEQGEFWKDEQILKAFYVNRSTVDRIRKSFVKNGLEETLKRKPSSNSRKCVIQGEEEAYLIALACGKPPEGHSRWTLRLLADAMVKLEYVDTISHETIRTTLKKMNLSRGRKKNGAFLQKPMPNLSAKWKKS